MELGRKDRGYLQEHRLREIQLEILKKGNVYSFENLQAIRKGMLDASMTLDLASPIWNT